MRLLLDIVMECYACIAFQILSAVYLILSVARPFPRNYGGRDSGRPLLLVHGYMNNPAVFWLLIARLRTLGITDIHAITLSPPWGSIEAFASQVGKAVGSILNVRPGEEVDILGHSMGGVVVAYYLKFLDGSKKTRNFLAVGTPFRGTYLACLGSGICAFQMIPLSRFIRRLDFKPGDVPSTKVCCLRAAFDEYVLPNRSAFLGSPSIDVRFSHLGHGGLLLSRKSASRIAEVLAS